MIYQTTATIIYKTTATMTTLEIQLVLPHVGSLLQTQPIKPVIAAMKTYVRQKHAVYSTSSAACRKWRTYALPATTTALQVPSLSSSRLQQHFLLSRWE